MRFFFLIKNGYCLSEYTNDLSSLYVHFGCLPVKDNGPFAFVSHPILLNLILIISLKALSPETVQINDSVSQWCKGYVCSVETIL